MEFHEIPERVSRFLRVVGEHWVSTAAPGRVEVFVKREGPTNTRRSLRLFMWIADGREPQSGRQLRPTCGVPWCCRPEHCGYPRRLRRYDKKGGPGKRWRTFDDGLEAAVFALKLERRGYVRNAKQTGALRIGEYRVLKTRPEVTWQEPARGWYPRASDMARRILRSRTERAAEQRRAKAA